MDAVKKALRPGGRAELLDVMVTKRGVSVRIACKAAHRLDVVQRVLRLWLRLIEPVSHEIDAQHLLHRLRLRPVTCLRVMRSDQR